MQSSLGRWKLESRHRRYSFRDAGLVAVIGAGRTGSRGTEDLDFGVLSANPRGRHYLRRPPGVSAGNDERGSRCGKGPG